MSSSNQNKNLKVFFNSSTINVLIENNSRGRYLFLQHFLNQNLSLKPKFLVFWEKVMVRERKRRRGKTISLVTF
jgi:hypothetical protein